LREGRILHVWGYAGKAFVDLEKGDIGLSISPNTGYDTSRHGRKKRGKKTKGKRVGPTQSGKGEQ